MCRPSPRPEPGAPRRRPTSRLALPSALVAALVLFGVCSRRAESTAGAAAPRPGPRGAPRQDVPPLRPAAVTIAPGIHSLGGVSPAAVYVVETSDGPIAIDSGLESDAATLQAEM